MGLRVVVVDDQPGYLAEARALLLDEGYVVVGEAVDGRSAVELVREAHPDVVLLDIQLPDASGFEVADAIKRQSRNVRVILISGREGADYGARLSGADVPFIAKEDLTGESLAAAIEGT